MANEHGRSAYAGNDIIWRKLAEEIRPAVDAAMLRAKEKFSWIEPWQANLSIISELNRMGPQPPWDENDEDDPGPPPEPEERGGLTLPWDEDDYSGSPQDEGGSLPPS